jgi:glutaredoxin-related protein
MPRQVLDENQIHPAIREQVAGFHIDVVNEVRAAVATHAVTVVGMAQNPFCKKARQALDTAGVAFHYLEYGSYLSRWQDRGALKMWSGWPTFPMVFVNGALVGGYTDLKRLIVAGVVKKG